MVKVLKDFDGISSDCFLKGLIYDYKAIELPLNKLTNVKHLYYMQCIVINTFSVEHSVSLSNSIFHLPKKNSLYNAPLKGVISRGLANYSVTRSLRVLFATAELLAILNCTAVLRTLLNVDTKLIKLA